jgi:hypothetical protein
MTSMSRLGLVVLFTTASVLTCGPWLTDYVTMETVRPADLEAYATRGEIGVVRPQFARRYLVQAYRRLSDLRPLPAVASLPKPGEDSPYEALKAWTDARSRAGGAAGVRIDLDRNIGDYQIIRNCLSGAFTTAVKTLADRTARYGASSTELRDWIGAQDQVFTNCGHEPAVIPGPPAGSADPLARADRQYQIASAYFYAMSYDEAVGRFRQIAADQASPWRPYGHYLAGRARLRQATLPKEIDRARLDEAQVELRRVLGDSGATFLHASARGLLDRIALRARPMERLRVLAASLAGAGAPPGDQALRDFEILMDAAVGDTTIYEYDSIQNRAALAATSEMNDWILVMQGTGPGATARAIARWKETQSMPWLTAALWKVSHDSADAPALLEAAARVGRPSPG